MSVRAHRINNIDFELGDTFNMWHDDKIADYVGKHQGHNLADGGTGIIELGKEDLRELRKLTDDKHKIEAIDRDLEWMDKHKEEYILYYLF